MFLISKDKKESIVLEVFLQWPFVYLEPGNGQKATAQILYFGYFYEKPLAPLPLSEQKMCQQIISASVQFAKCVLEQKPAYLLFCLTDQDFNFIFDQQPLGRRLFIEFCNTVDAYRRSLGFLNVVVSTYQTYHFVCENVCAMSCQSCQTGEQKTAQIMFFLEVALLLLENISNLSTCCLPLMFEVLSFVLFEACCYGNGQ